MCARVKEDLSPIKSLIGDECTLANIPPQHTHAEGDAEERGVSISPLQDVLKVKVESFFSCAYGYTHTYAETHTNTPAR